MGDCSSVPILYLYNDAKPKEMGQTWSVLLIFSRSLGQCLSLSKYIAFGMRFFQHGFIQGNSVWKFPHYNFLSRLSWAGVCSQPKQRKIPFELKSLLFSTWDFAPLLLHLNTFCFVLTCHTYPHCHDFISFVSYV